MASSSSSRYGRGGGGGGKAVAQCSQCTFEVSVGAKSIHQVCACAEWVASRSVGWTPTNGEWRRPANARPRDESWESREENLHHEGVVEVEVRAISAPKDWVECMSDWKVLRAAPAGSKCACGFKDAPYTYVVEHVPSSLRLTLGRPCVLLFSDTIVAEARACDKQMA
jgi:hypothetical protein